MDKFNTDQIPDILNNYKSIAVVGISDNPMRPSYQVAEYLINYGYKVFPVNPKMKTILGLECYPDLKSISEKVEIVDIFRRSEHVDNIVEEAIKIEAEVIWMQLGVVNQHAAQKAQTAGLKVIMDRCIKIEHRKI